MKPISGLFQLGNLPIVLDGFTFSAPTTGLNASRVLRGLQLKKPILLEGSPGVGKTSLVAALAKAAGYQLTRINVSDQTVSVTDVRSDISVVTSEQEVALSQFSELRSKESSQIQM